MDDHNVRRMFRAVTEDAGLGTGWVPRELRHTFVSLLSARGVPVEAIALLAGHNQTSTTKRGLVTVAGKPSDDLHPKTRDSMLRQAGLNEDGSQADKPGRGES
jgi:integrase